MTDPPPGSAAAVEPSSPPAPASTEPPSRAPRLSVGVQLFLGFFPVIAAVFVAFSWYTATTNADAWARSFDDHAAQTTAVIERVLRQQMLLGDKKTVHAAMHDIASAPGIRAVRIYDKGGVIRFSTDEKEIGTTVGRGREACVVCHGEPFRSARADTVSRVLRDRAGPVMAQSRTIRNGKECAGADCHEAPSRKPLLGVMDFQTSMAAVEQATDAARADTAYSAAAMAIAGGLVTLLMIWRIVRRPVIEIVVGMRAVAAGRLETRIEPGHSAELHEIGRAFNNMTRDLEAAMERQKTWEHSLADAIEAKTTELAAAHRRMTQMEKMASLGKLAAMVAHEINNPLAGVLVYAKLVLRTLGGGPVSEDDRAESLRYVEVIRQESARCGEIVKSLLSFARQSTGGFTPQSLNTVIDRSVMTVQHLFKVHGVTCTVVPLAPDDQVACDANEIQQALVALMVNAVEAMPSGGELRVAAVPEGKERVVLSVSDTGVGIPEDVQPQIFEPFFSTKGDEKGVGLGLAAVYGIVRRHEATIDVESEVGKGATFRITMTRNPKGPVKPEAAAGTRAAP